MQFALVHYNPREEKYWPDWSFQLSRRGHTRVKLESNLTQHLFSDWWMLRVPQKENEGADNMFCRLTTNCSIPRGNAKPFYQIFCLINSSHFCLHAELIGIVSISTETNNKLYPMCILLQQGPQRSRWRWPSKYKQRGCSSWTQRKIQENSKEFGKNSNEVRKEHRDCNHCQKGTETDTMHKMPTMKNNPRCRLRTNEMHTDGAA